MKTRSSRLASWSNSTVIAMSRFSRISTETTSRTSVKSATALTGRLSVSSASISHPGAVRQQRAAPAPRPEGADRGQCQDAGAERDDRPVRRKIVGGAADRGRQQDAVGHQLVEPDDAVDADPQFCGLPGLAQQRHLVEGDRAVQAVPCSQSRVISSGCSSTGCAAARRSYKPVEPVRIHQEPDAAAMHAEDRLPGADKAVQRFEHEPVAAERHDDVGLLAASTCRNGSRSSAKRLLRRLGLRGDKRDPRRRPASEGGGHPPVTLMWRDTAGRLWRRSMMKSCPFGLRAIASRIAASTASSLSDCRSGVRRSAASSCPRHI